MFRIGKMTEYALLAMAYLAADGGQRSAREVAAACGVPVPMAMKILKSLHHHRILESTRGTRGGYRLVGDLTSLSLYQLTRLLRCGHECGCLGETDLKRDEERMPTEPPLMALYFGLQRFMRGVKVSDLVVRGRKIDVPVERVRVRERSTSPVA